MNLEPLVAEEFCYLTTTGRVTGEPHEIEIWFALVPEHRTLYMMAGARTNSDWVKNLIRNPEISIKIAGKTLQARARIIEGEPDEPTARKMLVDKYEKSPGSLKRWGRESLPVALDLRHEE